MSELSVHAKRILDYLSETPDPVKRNLSALRDRLQLSKHDLLRGLDELTLQGLATQEDDWYDLTSAGWEQAKQSAPRDESAPGGINIHAGRDVRDSRVIQAGGDYMEGDKVGGDKVEGDKYDVQGDVLRDHARKINTGGGPYVEGGGIAAGRDLNISGGEVAGRDTIHIAGDVGPGAAIGSGASVRAQNIAGRDIITGRAVGGPNLESLASAEEVEALRDALDDVRADLEDLADDRLIRQAGRRIDRLAEALSLDDPTRPVNPAQLKSAADWLTANAPDLAGSVRSLLSMDVVKRILK